MSIKTLLMPMISQRLLSRERVLKRRAEAERLRLAQRAPHQIHYFHQVDDPYSALAAAALVQLAQRYEVDICPHVVGPPPDSAAPDRARLIAYSRKDAQRLAGRMGLRFADTGTQPPASSLARAAGLLVSAIDSGRFVELAGPVSASLWEDDALLYRDALADLPCAEAASVALHISTADAMRQRLGHYLGATFFYAGEWYWGIDRLHHLEQRLQDLDLQRPGVRGAMFPLIPDVQHCTQPAQPLPIDFYVSLRSPYSAIVAPRVFELGRRAGAPVRVRYVLPMVMRGLPVPLAKRSYISQDAAREAFVHGTPFGRVNDPVGRPTERGLALLALAERQGREESYLLSFMRGVWAEGIDAGSDRGLRRIAERAGLDWGESLIALKDGAWRETAEANRQAMFALGLWGVPSFKVGATAVWGQDRLWAVQEALLQAD
jgi:2-hydroxychromene-2-carboxylate isomerase